METSSTLYKKKSILHNFKALSSTYDVHHGATWLDLMQYTLDSNANLVWDRHTGFEDSNWRGFAELINKPYTSEIVHAHTLNTIDEVPLSHELKNRNYRAITKVSQKISSFVKDLPVDERTDQNMFQYLRSSVKCF